jgi:sulfite exporter TauE/SafE
MALSLLISAWLVGAVGGLHCLAMCGGFVAAASARDAALRGSAAEPLRPGAVLLREQLTYHAARVTAYALLGAIFGVAGAAAMDAQELLPVQRFLYLLANVALLALGLSLLARKPGLAWLQRGGAAAYARILPAVRPLLASPGPGGRIALGLVWGLVPCALVYSVLPLALFAGGAWQGALVMVCFGLGTLPNLFVAGVALVRARHWLQRTGPRRVAAGVLAGFAIAGLYRLAFMPEALAHGAFCIIP